MTERVLIHGVDTFMGRHLTAALTRSGWANPVGVVAADARALREALPLARVIIHCSVGGASTVRRSADLLYGALKARGEAPRVVHIGSMAVYGLVAGVVDEDSPTPADAGSYASAQLAAEMHQTEHSGVVILRSGVEIGPDCPHWSGRIARLLVERRLGDIGAAGDGICNLTYIEDLANVALTAARQPGIDGEIFNIASSAKLTWNDYFIEFARALGAVPVRRITPRRLALESKLFASPLTLAEIAAARLGLSAISIPPSITPSLLISCAQEMSLNVAKAELKLGAKWTPLEEALQATAAFYR